MTVEPRDEVTRFSPHLDSRKIKLAIISLVLMAGLNPAWIPVWLTAVTGYAALLSLWTVVCTVAGIIGMIIFLFIIFKIAVEILSGGRQTLTWRGVVPR